MLSNRALSALNATVFIAAKGHQHPPTTRELSAALGLSVSSLHGMLKLLDDHGIVRSFRGAEKRYEIKADPTTMTAWDVVQIFEDPHPPVAQNAKEKETASYDYENTYCEILKDFLASQKISDQIVGLGLGASLGASTGASAVAWA
ncbi:MAG: Rrf2 family transcriptional regulator [Alcaligenaceae bacterium]|nr:Rrf2 family transcriptional regulator [Alcaligenaceae bacterium]